MARRKPKLTGLYLWADYCTPCKHIWKTKVQPVVDKGAKIERMDAEQFPQIPRRYKINKLPSLIIYRNGIPADVYVGTIPDATVLEKIFLTEETEEHGN